MDLDKLTREKFRYEALEIQDTYIGRFTDMDTLDIVGVIFKTKDGFQMLDRKKEKVGFIKNKDKAIMLMTSILLMEEYGVDNCNGGIHNDSFWEDLQ